MDPRIKVICDRFEYNNSILLVDLFQIWQDKLEVEINKFKNSDCIFIVSNDLETTLKSIKKLDKDEKIPTDCRFFSLFIGNLVKNPSKKSIIRMMLNFNSFEIIVPENCLYLTPNTSEFSSSITKSNIKIPELMSVALKDNQGQWITCIDKQKNLYIGIVDEGAIIMELDNWVKRYKEKVEVLLKKNIKSTNYIFNKCTNTEDIYRNSMVSLFNCLIKIHGLKIACYKFNEILDDERMINILA